MRKYPVYAIMALAFLGIIKLLQVTAFDSEQYAENKKKSFSNSSAKTESTYKKKSVKTTENKTSQEMKNDPDSLESNIVSQKEGMDTVPGNEPSVDEFNTSEDNFDDAFSNNRSDESTDYRNFEELKNLYLAPRIAGLPQGQLREDVVIRYYRHEQDDDKVYILKDLGYYIHEKEANETAGLGSNVMYYGDEVNVEDIQIVAYQLLEIGLPIKAISPTRFQWKATSIEIGTDTLLLGNSDISEAYIRNFEKD